MYLLFVPWQVHQQLLDFGDSKALCSTCDGRLSAVQALSEARTINKGGAYIIDCVVFLPKQP